MAINWQEEVLKRKDDMIKDLQGLLQIKSVLDEESAGPGAPFGQGIKEALDYMLTLGEKDGYTVKNLAGKAAHIEYGKGEELIGILCHLDVVPEGDGWDSNPYGAEIRDGKIYARGAMDDKGPTIAAYYGLKIVKELGLETSKRVKIILGTDEESNWRCVDHYFENEEMPTMGFAPDADFPIINAEKGIYDFEYKQQGDFAEETAVDYKLAKFQSGRRLNMVPDHAEAQVQVIDGSSETLEKCFGIFLEEEGVTGKVSTEGNLVKFSLEGVSAHGSTPNRGKNAGLFLMNFLNGFEFDARAASFISFCKEYFIGDMAGKNLGIAFEDEVSGPLTLNVGTLTYDAEIGGKVGSNIRYPVTLEPEELLRGLNSVGEKANYIITELSHLRSLFVPEEHELIQKLSKVYEEQTGEKAELLSIGGGTYARSLNAGVAFGAQFPGTPDVAHQKNEFIDIEQMVKATALYAQAIYELAK